MGFVLIRVSTILEITYFGIFRYDSQKIQQNNGKIRNTSYGISQHTQGKFKCSTNAKGINHQNYKMRR